MGWGEPFEPGAAGKRHRDEVRRGHAYLPGRIPTAPLSTRLREHAELHSDSKDILLEAAAMLDPTKES